MYIPKTKIFIDGENLTMRYQEMVKKGMKPTKDVLHIPDIFVWHPEITTWSMFDIIRVSYYTSIVGDEKKIHNIKKQISEISYEFIYDSNSDTPSASHRLFPCVYKKVSKSRKTRSVDINIIIDVMRCVFSEGVDLIYLLSGDGDYLPLLKEIGRRNKTLFLSAFSSGLNPNLIYSCDEFFPLDELFFESIEEKTKSVINSQHISEG